MKKITKILLTTFCLSHSVTFAGSMWSTPVEQAPEAKELGVTFPANWKNMSQQETLIKRVKNAFTTPEERTEAVKVLQDNMNKNVSATLRVFHLLSENKKYSRLNAEKKIQLIKDTNEAYAFAAQHACWKGRTVTGNYILETAMDMALKSKGDYNNYLELLRQLNLQNEDFNKAYVPLRDKLKRERKVVDAARLIENELSKLKPAAENKEDN